MPQGQGEPYSFDHERLEDGAIHFRCSTDALAWPWLTLAPQHPLVIQTQNFWTSYGAILFDQGMKEGQWSALTWMDWALGDARADHAVRGVYNRVDAEAGPAFSLMLFDACDREVAAMRGRGVVFRNRNFEQWREGAKQEAKSDKPSLAFVYAGPEALGLGDGEFAFVAQLEPGAMRVAALVTPENGMPPSNRVISGSGDHVNTTHLGEVTRQALCLVTGDAGVQVTGGEMTLKRYIELGTPFVLHFATPSDQAVTFTIEQRGKPCAEISLRW